MSRIFALDRANGKLMGVCAGAAETTGMDPTFVRLLAVLSALVLGPVALFLYVVTGLVAPNRG